MKRFTDTDKWKDEWFGSLKPTEKLVFMFILDNCDNAGFFDLNKRLNSFLLGVTEDEYLGAVKGLNRGLIGATLRERYFVRNFLIHQKNLPLNPENNAHKQIIYLLEQNQPFFSINLLEILGAKEGLISPLGKGIGKGNKEIKDEILKNRIEWDRICMNLLSTEKECLEHLDKFILKNSVGNGFAGKDVEEISRWFVNWSAKNPIKKADTIEDFETRGILRALKASKGS